MQGGQGQGLALLAVAAAAAAAAPAAPAGAGAPGVAVALAVFLNTLVHHDVMMEVWYAPRQGGLRDIKFYLICVHVLAAVGVPARYQVCGVTGIMRDSTVNVRRMRRRYERVGHNVPGWGNLLTHAQMLTVVNNNRSDRTAHSYHQPALAQVFQAALIADLKTFHARFTPITLVPATVHAVLRIQ